MIFDIRTSLESSVLSLKQAGRPFETGIAQVQTFCKVEFCKNAWDSRDSWLNRSVAALRKDILFTRKKCSENAAFCRKNDAFSL